MRRPGDAVAPDGCPPGTSGALADERKKEAGGGKEDKTTADQRDRGGESLLLAIYTIRQIPYPGSRKISGFSEFLLLAVTGGPWRPISARPVRVSTGAAAELRRSTRRSGCRKHEVAKGLSGWPHGIGLRSGRAQKKGRRGKGGQNRRRPEGPGGEPLLLAHIIIRPTSQKCSALWDFSRFFCRLHKLMLQSILRRASVRKHVQVSGCVHAYSAAGDSPGRPLRGSGGNPQTLPGLPYMRAGFSRCGLEPFGPVKGCTRLACWASPSPC